MCSEITIENITKATQTADLLLSDLLQLNKSGGDLISLLVLPEIEKISGLKGRLEQLLVAIQA